VEVFDHIIKLDYFTQLKSRQSYAAETMEIPAEEWGSCRSCSGLVIIRRPKTFAGR